MKSPGIFVGKVDPLGEIELWEALVLFGVYLGYVVVMAFNRQIFKLVSGKELPIRPEKIVHFDDEACNEISGIWPFTFHSGLLDSKKLPSGEARILYYFKYFLLLPIFCVLRVTVPDVRRPEKQKYCYISFLISTIWILVFTYFMVGEYHFVRNL